jgi:hypothetical protein
MTHCSRAVLSLLAFLTLPAGVTSQAPSHAPTHNWDYLTFSPANAAGMKGPGFLVGFGDKSNGLRVIVNELALDVLKNRITASLHRAGRIVEPGDPNFQSMAISTRTSGRAS